MDYGGADLNRLISASILNANMLHLEEEVRRLEENGADMLHFDVMDGVFVPNISFGLPVLHAISGVSSLYKDVHLMIENPILYITEFAKAGADLITFHLESNSDPFRTIDLIHETGCKVGVSLKPGTPARALLPFLDEIDMILVMTVEPGFGGQSYMHDMTAKIMQVRDMIAGRSIRLEVDGGINPETADEAAGAGAEVLVAGSYLFRHENMHKAILSLREGDRQ